MADGVLGRKKVVAVQLVEEEDRGAHGLATIQHLRAVVQPVLEALPKTPTATPSVVLSTVVGALGQTMEPAAKPVEEAPRPEPGLAPVHHLPVVEQPVPEAHTKTRTATPSAVLSTVAGVLGLPMEPAAKLVEEEPRPEPGLAQVPLLPAVARPVLEALPKQPTATPSAVLSMGVGAHGPTMEPAAEPVEEAPKPEPGLARVQHFPVVAPHVLEALPKTPTATPSAVLSTGVGAHGQIMEPAAKRVEEARRQEPGLARVQHHPVVAQPVLEALPKTPTATPSAVRFMVDGAPGPSGGLAKASFRRYLTTAAMGIHIKEAKECEQEVALAHRHHVVELNVLETHLRTNPVSPLTLTGL